LVHLQSKFSICFPETTSGKHKWITDPFHADSPQNYDLSLEEEENCIDNTSDTSLKVLFLRKSYIGFRVGMGVEFLHLSRKAFNLLLPSATAYLSERTLSGGSHQNKVSFCDEPGKDFKAAISKLQPRYDTFK
jgi:hypothetical protein